MKKTLLILLSILSLQLYGQELSFIPKVGYNAAHVSGLDDSKTKHGINAGLSVEYRFSNPLAIECGVFYSMQGTSMEYEYGKNFVFLNFDLDNDYINIPLLIKGYVYKGLHIYGGPQAGFLINSKLNISGDVNLLDLIEWNGNDSFDMGKYQHKFDLSGIVGLGYQFNIGLIVSANYNFGLNALFKSDDTEFEELDFIDFSGTRNQVFQLNLGWKF